LVGVVATLGLVMEEVVASAFEVGSTAAVPGGSAVSV